MADPRFFRRSGPMTLRELARISNSKMADISLGERIFDDVKSISDAGPRDVSFLDNKRYAEAFVNSRAGACIIEDSFVKKAPEGMALLVTKTPYVGYALISAAFYPNPTPVGSAIADTACINCKASVGDNCYIGPGAIIQAGVEIGPNTKIESGAVVGTGVVIGADTFIGPNVTLSNCLIGDRVIIHPGARIGQDGFGFASSHAGHLKVPQIGRVLVGDDVEIGANTTVDRGSGPDTIVGAGTKIDNLVQIGHNVKIGKGCIIVSQVGISGSTEIGDFVIIGGQAGLAGHLRVGDRTKIAAKSGVTKDLEADSTVGGFPAKTMRTWLREKATLERLTRKKRS